MILAFELLAYAKPLFNSHLTIIVEDYNKLVYQYESRDNSFHTFLLFALCFSCAFKILMDAPIELRLLRTDIRHLRLEYLRGL
ncbi:hypothetical protein GEMRC1_000554 [Eukaryota sp. GEM-RC1]